jgi:hypothetical protein
VFDVRDWSEKVGMNQIRWRHQMHHDPLQRIAYEEHTQNTQFHRSNKGQWLAMVNALRPRAVSEAAVPPRKSRPTLPSRVGPARSGMYTSTNRKSGKGPPSI